MKRIEAIWNAEIIAHRADEDCLVLISVAASCVIINNGGPTATPPQLMHDSAVAWITEQLNVDALVLDVLSLTWSEMPHVDADQ